MRMPFKQTREHQLMFNWSAVTKGKNNFERSQLQASFAVFPFLPSSTIALVTPAVCCIPHFTVKPLGKLHWGFQSSELVWKQKKDSHIQLQFCMLLSAQKIWQRTNAEEKMPIWRSQGFKGNKEAMCYTWLGYNVPGEEHYPPNCILHFKKVILGSGVEKHLKHGAALMVFYCSNWHWSFY